MIDAVIFDMDGTLVDSERLGFTGWREAGKRLGATIPDDLMRSFIGHNAAEVVAMCTDYLGDADLAQRVFDLHWDIRRERTATDLTLLPGVHEALSALKAAGMRLAVCTSSDRPITESNLSRFGILDAFESITCGDEVKRGKPNPQIYTIAAQKLGVSPDACAVVEDSPNGVRAGYAAGMTVFMVPNVIEPTREMVEKTARILGTLHELPAAIAEVAGAQD